MGQFKDISIKDVMEEINVSYFLPDIQREYVWLDKANENKIEQLFDSILRGYPIGSFLFWKLKTSDVETDKFIQDDRDKLNFQLYKFMEDYDVRNPHNKKIDITKVNSNDLHIVLDGQQRLTSLFIGLKGSRTLKKPKGWWDNPNSFEKKMLYLNLRYKPNEEDAEDGYRFEFKNSESLPENDADNYWFKVGEILEITSLNKYCRENGLDDNAADTLELLKNAICTERLISYYEESEKNLNKVLKIFIRVNSGGTQLTYSDLLMSILTANFSSDIRDSMNTFVDNIRSNGFGCFGRDQVLKTCFILVGINHKFILKNFSKQNISEIEDKWSTITEKILDAIEIIKDFGYSDQLSSGYIITTIALYLYNKSLGYGDINKAVSEKNEMWKFVRNAQITSFFSTSHDWKLSSVIDVMSSSDNFKKFNDKMEENRLIKITKDDIDGMLMLQHGNPATLPVLQVLYPNLDYKNSTFHVDHIYPKSKFTPKNSQLPSECLGSQNTLFNLQLLQGQENISKRDKDPAEWLSSHFGNDTARIEAYKKENYIEQNFSMKWEDFKDFQTMRTENLREALKKVFV